MKKPEKREFGGLIGEGYNQACKDWEKWIKEDIIKYLETYEPNEFKTIGLSNKSYVSEAWHIKDHLKRLTKALSKRLRGEND